jgi:ankyrin repeat protein
MARLFMYGGKAALCFLIGVSSMCAQAGPGATAPIFLGIRLGEPLEAQLRPCAGADLRWTDAAQPCWRQGSRGERTVALPRRLQSLSPSLSVHYLTEAQGRVVEIELEFRPEDFTRVQQHFEAQYGPPAETEEYERHSRVGGVSRHRALTWKVAGTTVVLQPLAQSDRGSVRAYLDQWAQAESARQREEAARAQAAADARLDAMRREAATPAAAVSEALMRRDATGLKALLARRPDLKVASWLGTTVLHTAAVTWGDIDVLRRLLDAGAPVDARNDAGRTPLAEAMASAHYRSDSDAAQRLIAVFDLLVARGAKAQVRDRAGQAPMSHVLGERHLLPVADHMLGAGVPLPEDALLVLLAGNATDDDVRHLTRLMDAVTPAHAAARGADGRTAMHLAVQRAATLDLLGGLIEFGAPLEARSGSGQTPFLEAAFYGNVAAMELLAKHGANIRATDDEGSTALHLAAPFARVAQIRWLVAHGLDPNARDRTGRRPFDLAVKSDRYGQRPRVEQQEVATLLGGSGRASR